MPLPFTPRLALQRELSRRCGTNPRYSLRGFARALGMSHTVLSLVLSGKRPLSRKASARIAQLIELSPEERAAFLSHRSRTSLGDANAADVPGFHQITLDAFALLSDWYHYAILGLLDLPSFRSDSKWIAKKLGIGELEAKLAWERLQRMDLVVKRGQRWRQSTASLRVDNTEGAAAIRKFHRQLLEKALFSLENDPFEERNFTAVTMTVDPKQAAYAKERMIAFQRELMRELESKGSPQAVYALTLQCFPLSRKESV